MTTQRSTITTLLVVCAVLVSSPAAGQDDDQKQGDARGATDHAAELFRSARTAAEAGEPKRAALLYAQADAIQPHAITKYNEALEWERDGELARAADAYTLALDRRQLDTARVSDARRRLAQIQARVAAVHIIEPIGARVSVAHVVDAEIPTRLHLAVGQHDVVMRDTGCRATKTIDARAGAELDIVMVCASAARAKPFPIPSPEPKQAPSRWQLGLGWTLFAVGAASALSLPPLAVVAVNANERWKDSGLTDDPAREQAVTFRAATNVMLGVAIASTGVGLTLILLD